MLEITVEVSIDELKPFLEKAAAEISETKKIDGFRPGKAPYNIVAKEVGEMTIYQTAARDAVAHFYYDIIEKENLETVEQPEVDMKKLAPGNPFEFIAKVALLPKVEVCDLEKVNVEPIKEIKIEEKEVEKVLNDLQKMRGKDIAVDAPAEKGNKVELSFNTFIDNVPIEGGQASKHQLTIGEGMMIPGFEDNLIGLKREEEKEFDLTFPKNYHAKQLAGKEAKFKIKILNVFKIELPELNDEFAKGLGLKSADDLRKNIESNIKLEKETKAKQAQEIEIIEKLIEKSKFEELPDILINQETHKMIHELEDNVARQGLKFEDYLAHMKKTEAEFRLDFVPDAIKRVQTGLLIRQIAKANNITATHEEVHEEMERTIASYKMHPAYAGQAADLEKNLHSDDAHHYFENLIANRKTMDMIKEKTIKK